MTTTKGTNVAKSNRAETAARAAQLRADAARQERQRKQVIAAVVAVVVVIIAVTLGVVIANQPKGPAPAATGADAALSKLTSLPVSTLDAAVAPTPSQAPQPLQGGTALTQDGKPKVLYVGAEYCPFCAMERWALIGALSRFGTFSGLTPTTSSSTDVHPDTPTWSFANAKFDSDKLAFQAVETQDRNGQPLQTLEGDNLAMFSKYNPGGGIPWINYGGTHATNGATVDANVIDGKTYDQIIAGIQDPKSDIGKTMDPAINMISAQLCQLTKGQPTNVCTSPSVMSASVLLKN
jgi:thiol-disulfide isomerase/thioredoxin